MQGCTISTCYNFHVTGCRRCLQKFSSPTDTYLYDKSLKDGLLPDSWKEATVIAIHKKGVLEETPVTTDQWFVRCYRSYDKEPYAISF